MVWTSLNVDVQKEIVRRMDGGESPYNIAGEYGLNSSSLARKYRRIKQKRNTHRNPVVENTSGQTIKTQTYIQRQPTITPLFSQSNKFFDLTVLGAENALPDERNAWINTKRPLTILFYTDTHFNHHDQAATDAFLRAAKIVPHDLIIHGGDALDCYGLSRYGKDIRKIFTHSFKQELNTWKTFAGKLNDISSAEKMMIHGNHMQRYYDWLMQPANQALLEMPEMQLDYLMRLSEFGYSPFINSIYVDGDLNYDFPNPFLLVHHGEVARKDAGNSARTESANRGYVSSISGHTHRLGVSYKRTMRGQIVNAEGGTLGTLQPEWMQFPDWAQGFLIIEYDFSANYISINPVCIVNGHAYIDGVRV